MRRAKNSFIVFFIYVAIEQKLLSAVSGKIVSIIYATKIVPFFSVSEISVRHRTFVVHC